MTIGLVIILAMLASIAGFIFVQAQKNRTAALLFVPYAAWVAFAATLNYALVVLNQGNVNKAFRTSRQRLASLQDGVDF